MANGEQEKRLAAHALMIYTDTGTWAGELRPTGGHAFAMPDINVPASCSLEQSRHKAIALHTRTHRITTWTSNPENYHPEW